MAKFNFSNFKESLNGSTKRAKNTQVKRSDSSRYSKGKRSAASDQNLGWRIAKYAFIGLLTFFVICVIAGGGLFAYYVSSVPKLTENKLQSTNSSRIYDGNGSLIADLGSEKRESASTDEIPIILVNAITSISVSLPIAALTFIVLWEPLLTTFAITALKGDLHLTNS